MNWGFPSIRPIVQVGFERRRHGLLLPGRHTGREQRTPGVRTSYGNPYNGHILGARQTAVSIQRDDSEEYLGVNHKIGAFIIETACTGLNGECANILLENNPPLTSDDVGSTLENPLPKSASRLMTWQMDIQLKPLVE
jgi:hypothetical protein